MKAEMRSRALAQAIDYHSRTYGPVNYGAQQMGYPDRRPSPDEIIATAEKFAGFLLVDKKALQPRSKR